MHQVVLIHIGKIRQKVAKCNNANQISSFVIDAGPTEYFFSQICHSTWSIFLEPLPVRAAQSALNSKRFVDIITDDLSPYSLV